MERKPGVAITVFKNVRRKLQDDEFLFGWVEVRVRELGGKQSPGN